MPQTTIINKFGKISGWNSMSCRIFNRTIEAFNEAEYHDKVTRQNEYGAGGYPIGQSTGNYETENCSISFYMEEIIALQESIPTGLRLQDAPATDVIFEYDLNGKIYKDIWRNATILNNGRAVKNGDGKIVTKIDFLPSHIDYGVK